MPTSLDGKVYWEFVFWGGGHALQFTWTLLMLVAWLWLAEAPSGLVLLGSAVTLAAVVLALRR